MYVKCVKIEKAINYLTKHLFILISNMYLHIIFGEIMQSKLKSKNEILCYHN